MNLLIRLILNAIVLLGIAYFVPGFEVANFYTALIVAICLALINAVIKPILLLLTLPITIITLGLFALIVNLFLFWFVSTFVKGFTIETFWAAFWGWLLYSLFGAGINSLLKDGN